MAYGSKTKALHELYANPCNHLHTLGDDATTELISDTELEAWVKDIYQTGKGKMHLPTVQKLAQHLWAGVSKGYGKDLLHIDLETPDAEMLTHLLTNCYTFSAAKNRTHLQMLTSLINNNGKVREWNDYYEEAKKLNLKLNKTWLKTEYDLAIAGATMASKWVQFSANKNTMLRYSTVGDERVRLEHQAMDGITLPATHTFWNTHYPPNGFKCRCDVDSIPYGTPSTNDSKLPGIDDDTVPPIFQTNLAKAHLVFPKNHPYYTVLTSNTGTPIEDLIPSNLNAYEKLVGKEIDRSIFSYLKKPVPLDLDNKKGDAYYMPNKRVTISLVGIRAKNKTYLEKVLYHEYGHAVDHDHHLRYSQPVADLMDKYRKLFKKDKQKQYVEIHQRLFKLRAYAIKKGNKALSEYTLATADTLMSLNPNYGWGHTKTYFKRGGMKEAEFLAHMFENVFSGNPVYKKVMPELYDDTLLLWEQLKKDIILK